MNKGYSICFNEWALDKDIKNELGLLLIISSLCAEKGYCYANNKYLAEVFDTNEITISRKIKLLESKNYISIEYEKRGCQVISRKLRLTKLLIDDYQNCESTINKNVKENNIINNNINNNIIIKEINKEKIADLTEEFEEVWKLYPKKKGKSSSLKKYIEARTKGIEKETIEKGIENYNKEIELTNKNYKYIKDGSTWFNQECWNDEYEILENIQDKQEEPEEEIEIFDYDWLNEEEDNHESN